MTDKFTCNSCGTVTGVGYFYCEQCHRLHKRKNKKQDSKENANDVLNAGSVMPDVSD